MRNGSEVGLQADLEALNAGKAHHMATHVSPHCADNRAI
jgi:hypothetical protein